MRTASKRIATRTLMLVLAAGSGFVTGNIKAQNIHVNFEGYTDSQPPEFEIESTLEGPAGGLNTQWNQFSDEDSASPLVDSTGAATTVEFRTNFTEGRYNGSGTALTMLRTALTDFDRGLERTLTITGLEAGDLYNIWLVSYRDSGSTRERIVGTWSTTHTTASPTTQLIDNRPNNNGSTFVHGYNYVLFENVVADAAGQIVFEGNGADTGEGYDDDYRLGLNGFQITPGTPREPLRITDISYDADNDKISLSWTSNPGEVYGLQWSTDLVTFYPDIYQSIPAHASDAETSFGPFESPVPWAERLFLRIGTPDTEPPVLLSMGGSGDQVVLTYSEPMLPGTATDPANYLLDKIGEGAVTILSAEIGTHPNTVVLTLGALLDEGASYTVTVNNVTDPAGLPITPGSQTEFTAWSGPVINEFMASNGSNIYNAEIHLDEDGNSSDWIEIFNPTAAPVNLDGWYLTDDADNLTKWRIPDVTIGAGSYLLIFASDKDRSNPAAELHTNFNLSSSGEYLALVQPNGLTTASEFSPVFPSQTTGLSYGLVVGSGTEFLHFDAPSPGLPNSNTGFLGIVGDTEFNIHRGFYESPINVQVTSLTPGATIRYTLDMSEPTLSNGITVTPSVPLPVTTTTCLRARAFMTGWLPSNIDTQTYIFPEDVIAQPNNPPGFPSTWGNRTAEYALDPSVTGRYTSGELEDSLKSLPSISIVTEMDNLFDNSTGIYDNPYGEGFSWERPASMEWIDPNGGPETQLNCGIRIQGNAARQFPKKSFRLLFKTIYGSSKLEFPVFAEAPDAVERFDTIVLRSNTQNRTGAARWHIPDENGRRTLLDMGTPQSHGTWVHLYVNGLYWGLYNPSERPQASFCSNYFGGSKDEWDANNGNTAIDGSYAPFDAMLAQVRGGPADDAAYQKIQGNKPDGTPDSTSPAYLDMPNYIDYMLSNFYLGTQDWARGSSATRNYYCGRRRTDDSPGYEWFIWDAEASLNSGIPTDVFEGPAEPYAWLKNNAEFQLLFADHAHRHLLNDGALTAGVSLPRFTAIADQIRPAMIFDEARWEPPNVDFFEEQVSNRSNNWFPGRAAAVLNRLRNEGLYPFTDAPVFSQHGGSVSSSTPVTMDTDANTIYYTLDGSDPRLPGGAVAPGALAATFGGGGVIPVTYLSTGHIWRYLDDGSDQGTAWRATRFNHSTWASGPSQLGYGSNNEGSGSEVGFGSDANNKFPTTYFRTTVDIPDPATWDHFLMRIKYDDGIAVYINGVEVERPNLAADAAYDDFALGVVADEDGWKDFTLATDNFVAGTNTIAVEVHQTSGASSDIRLDMILRGEPAGGGGTNMSDPLYFSEPATLKARSFSSGTGDWSALNEAFFSVDSEPASAANLVISEIHYRPGKPSTAAELAESTDRDDYEFIELYNIGPKALNLTGVVFNAGISFAFADNTLLPSGARLVLVRDLAAFTARYGPPAPGQVGGEYSGRLSNDGEQVTLSKLGVGSLHDLTYNDQLPWPVEADGDGYSLVLLNPDTAPDHALPTNWAASSPLGGTPGGAD